MNNQLNINFTTEYNDEVLEQLVEKQQYLDYIDADIEAYYENKIDNLVPENA